MSAQFQPPVINAPPPLPREPARRAAGARQALLIVLNLCLGLFLLDGVVSLADDSLAVLFDVRFLAAFRGILALLALLLAFVVYVLIGLTPMVPKRLFLPVTLFTPAFLLALIPLTIYFYGRFELVAWSISLCQVVLGLAALAWAQGGFKWRWPLVANDKLGSRRFSWLNLVGFLVVNVLVLLPAVAVYLAISAALAVSHFSEGFLALRPGGCTVQVRKYVRNDGKSIHLVPMAHIGEPDFYRLASHSFPSNAVVLMEGVTDHRNLLTNTISYARMATTLGLAEQQKEFNPIQTELVMADVDVAEFTPQTIGLLNLVMLVHARGLTPQNLLEIVQFSPPPHYEELLIDDLIRKRNQRVLDEIQTRLSDPQPIIVPWGVAHMPGIAKGLKAAGFRLDETREHAVIRFRFGRKQR